jgi:cellulose synthase/poly-beta-1,6-N-acetylglucosamine synthase-like glycosyltransferase
MTDRILHGLFFIITMLLTSFVVYQTILMLAGHLYIRRLLRKRDTLLMDTPELPGVTLLIPAHNEEKVIERTVNALLALEYPAGKLEVLVMDDASSDRTPEILDRMAAADPRVKVIHRSKEIGGRGKSAVLNHALQVITNDFIGIYDADNCPEPNAIKLLMAHMVQNPQYGGVVGKFRTGNRRRNFLTRFINIEGLTYQGIIQTGRSQLFGVAMLTGTNYIIRRSVVEAVGGWDEEALTEDAELTARIYQAGYRVAFVPDSISWEQEPETLRVWVKQRTRWARGNLYVLARLIQWLPTARYKGLLIEMFLMLSAPFFLLYTFFATQSAILMAVWKWCTVGVPIRIDQGLILSVCLYTLQVLIALSYDDEDTLENWGLCIASYFTYCQAWLIPFSMAIYSEYIRRDARAWDKTVRFDTLVLKDNSSIQTEEAPRRESTPVVEPTRL